MAEKRAKRTGNAFKQYYQNRRAHDVETKNRQRRQEKHHERHPNDQTPISTKARRKKPEQKGGWLTRQQQQNLGMGNMINPEEKGREYGRKDAKHLAQVMSHSRAVARQLQYSKNHDATPNNKGTAADKLKEINPNPNEE